ncbi:helix-turn-helix domain-containing protein [Devosia sp.]|uniref:helix-turn-helix domain-containing protein n=1 Tax=Devosia sp. TaxID=1871048 RepID=UPI001AD43C0B|nr:helix-turn-helix domain-containing protein [Devosia sp.]
MTILTDDQAALLLRVTPHTLRRWRARGIGPAWLKLVGSIRYLEDDLLSFAAAARKHPHTEAGND